MEWVNASHTFYVRISNVKPTRTCPKQGKEIKLGGPR